MDLSSAVVKPSALQPTDDENTEKKKIENQSLGVHIEKIPVTTYLQMPTYVTFELRTNERTRKKSNEKQTNTNNLFSVRAQILLLISFH